MRTPSGRVELAPAPLLNDVARAQADLARAPSPMVVIGRRDHLLDEKLRDPLSGNAVLSGAGQVAGYDCRMIEGPRAVFLHVTDLDIGRAWYSRALETEPDCCDAESVTFYVGGCELTLKLTDASGQAGTSVYWGVDNLAWEYRRISGIGREPAPSAQLAHIDSNAMEVLDPFGNVFGLVAVGGRNERTARHRRTAQKLALQNVRQTLDQLQEKEGEQKRIHRVVAWVVAVAVLLALGFAWTVANMQATPADTLPKLPLGTTGKQ